ncbi:hypothetical protein BH24ACT21_BH24ACT21_18870 [soil metagenome]
MRPCKRRSVILSIEEYEKLLEAFEDLQDLQAADKALREIESGENELVPWEQVKGKIGSEYEECAGRP